MSESGSAPSSAPGKQERTSLFDRLRLLFRVQGGSRREEIEDALKEASESSELSTQEKVLLENVLSLHELRVQDVMVPRADIIAVEEDISLFELLSVFRTAGHSRLPVYKETLDDPIGMVHIRDFVDYVARAAEIARVPLMRKGVQEGWRVPANTEKAAVEAFDLSVPLSRTNIKRSVLFASPSMPALDLLVRMQSSRTHMALVIDEYGGTDGLASIEDIVEKIVGNIEDEHDLDEQPKIEASGDGAFLVDARVELQDLQQALGRELPSAADLEEIDTVGGFITKVCGRVPAQGETFTVDDLVEFEILDADPRRIKLVKARPLT